jgi:ubiquinone/menaquinone biosynthesis C-methylase UbiE
MRGVEQIPIVYDSLMAVQEALGLGRWRRWLASGARGRTLDVGCGTGRNLPYLGNGARAVGLDTSEEALRRARRRSPETPLVRGSVEALPFKDGSFDTVVSGLVFCSVGDPKRGLLEVRRVLRDDGHLRMLEHVRSTSRFGARVQDFVQPAWTKIFGGCHPNRDTEATVAAAGFEIVPGERRAKKDMRRFAARKA